MILNARKISRLKKYFQSKPVLKAYLFGSYSRKEQNDQSDIDILVELDYSEPIGLEFISMKNELEKMFNRRVDLLSAQAVSKHIEPFIEEDKILIYER